MKTACTLAATVLLAAIGCSQSDVGEQEVVTQDATPVVQHESGARQQGPQLLEQQDEEVETLDSLRSSPFDFLVEGIDNRPSSVELLDAESKLVIERLIEGFPDQPDPLEIKGRLQFLRAEYEDALRTWEKCLELTPNYVHAFHGLGKIAVHKGQNDQAVTMFRHALDLDPSSSSARSELAMALINTKQAAESVSLLQDNIQADPQNVRGQVLLGTAHMQLGEYDKARKVFESAIQANPMDRNAHLGLVQAYKHLGLTDSANDHMAKHQELMADEPDSRNASDNLATRLIEVANAYVDAARVCLGKGHPNEAEILLRRAAAIDSKNVDSRTGLAFLYDRSYHLDDAIRILGELAEIQPDNPKFRLEIARHYVRTGQLESAELTLRHLCETFPTSPHGFVGLATLLIQQGREPEETLGLARKAVDLVPLAGNYALLSTAFERNDDTAGAIAAITEAIKLEPDNSGLRQVRESLLRRVDVTGEEHQ